MTVKQPRVLHLINSQQRRGAEVFAAQLASYLQKHRRFENLVCSLYERGDDDLPLEEVPVLKLGYREGVVGRLALNPRLLSRLCGLLRNFQPAVIVAHGGDTLKYTVSAGLFYRKAVTVYRNIGTASVWANSSTRVILNRLLLKRIDAVVSVSQSIKQDFINVYRIPEEKVTFIPNSANVPALDNCAQRLTRIQTRRELGLSEEDLTLISVGDLSPEKGYQDLLSLLAKFRERGGESQALLVGDGPLRQELQQQAEKLGLGDRVQFLGRRADVPALLAAADLFVLPSKTEGMPAVLIEAGMAGLPSVAFDVGGVAEVLDHGVTGILVAPGDLAGFEEALARLCLDQDCRTRMADAARQRCRDLFDIRKVALEYEELFLKILKPAPMEGNGNS